MHNLLSASTIRVASLLFSVLFVGAVLTGRHTAAESVTTDAYPDSFRPPSPTRQLRYQAWRHQSFPQAQALQTPAAERTVDQVQKNIQVFKGLPQWQLIPVMNFISASLGVKCNYCHVNNAGTWAFESDDKPEKQTAREMIKMVLNINKTTFRGSTEVSCYTCHRGHTAPVGVPTLPLPEVPQRTGERGAGGAGGPVSASGPGNAQGGAAPTAQALPSGDDVLNKYLTAIGGQAAIEKLNTRVMKGTSVNANGMTMTYEVYQAAPDKFYLLLSGPRGSMERGFNGGVGWEKNPAGVHDITGQQLAEFRRAFQLFGDLKLKEQFTRMNVGKDKIDGRDVYVIRATAANGRRERLYFDAETSLLFRRISFLETPIGIIPEQVDFEDYRDVEGIKVPFTIRISAVDSFSTAVRKFTEVKLNVPVDETKFNKPAATPPHSQ